jgi:ATP-dependent exoDNAse (exonuclease V) alpha subunit
LEKGSGIKSTTLAQLNLDAGFNRKEARDPLTAKDVLVVDEAGMSGSRQMEGLLREADRAGAKVVLVGDTRQLQSIEAGGAFRAIQDRVGKAELSDIRRQISTEDREVVQALREGRADDALNNLAGRDRLHGYSTAREAKAAAGQAVAADMADGKRSIALTATRAEARDVNTFAREAAREQGLLHGDDMSVNAHAGQRDFAVGERVLFTRNNRQLDIKNGDLATIKELRDADGKKSIVAALDRGGDRTIDPAKYDHIDHGYAVTAHKSQGSTVDRAHVVAAEQGMASREWAYVAGSRHRESLNVHADKSTLSELAPSWSKQKQKDVSLDYAPAQVAPAAPAIKQIPTMEISR